jgi:uncharacterized protein (DUF433 family)
MEMAWPKSTIQLWQPWKEVVMLTESHRAERSWIQKTSDVCGGDPCARNTRITVHGIVEYRKLGLSDDEILKRISGLTLDDLEAAFGYYQTNRQEIDGIIRAEAEA